MGSDTPAIDLIVPEAAPPGHDPIDEDDAGRKQRYPTNGDAGHDAVACIVSYDGSCKEQGWSSSGILISYLGSKAHAAQGSASIQHLWQKIDA